MSDNPPAFPLPNINQPGMTLRDWFAGQSVMTATALIGEQSNQMGSMAIAVKAYEIADAMLEARKAKP